ncbi:hypothetical protein RI367_007220 [Sorochytrium milnesiophthora]
METPAAATTAPAQEARTKTASAAPSARASAAGPRSVQLPVEKPGVEGTAAAAAVQQTPEEVNAALDKMAGTLTSRQQQQFKRLRERFAVFDKNSEGVCDAREVGTLLRSMGVYPSEKQLKEFVAQMVTHDNITVVTLRQFVDVAWPLIANDVIPRDNEDKLYRAFQVLDVEKKGYLTKEELKSFIMRLAEPFSETEAEEMLAACADPQDGKIYYGTHKDNSPTYELTLLSEEYVSVLAQD